MPKNPKKSKRGGAKHTSYGARRARATVESCIYCGIELHNQDCECPQMATVDHIFPRSQGGGTRMYDGRRNWVIACKDCNNDKADERLSDWLRRTQRKHLMSGILEELKKSY